MSLSWLLTYLGGAFLWASAVCIGLAVLGRLLGQRGSAWIWVAVWVLCFFVILTHYPVPDWSTFTCFDPATAPNWHPFNFMAHFQMRQAQTGQLWGAIWDKTFLSMGMNFAICATAGLALVAARIPMGVVLCIGVGLPLLIETSQLTGVFGLAPCPYRQFDIDDIILNAAGMLCGALAMRIWARSADQRL